jgi:hypothetical protein
MPNQPKHSYATDEHGIRRLIAAGDEVPEGWTAEGKAEEPRQAEKQQPPKQQRSSR